MASNPQGMQRGRGWIKIKRAKDAFNLYGMSSHLIGGSKLSTVPRFSDHWLSLFEATEGLSLVNGPITPGTVAMQRRSTPSAAILAATHRQHLFLLYEYTHE